MNMLSGVRYGVLYFCENPCITWFSLCQIVSYYKGCGAY